MWSACKITFTPFLLLAPHQTQVKLSLVNTAVRHNLYSDEFRIFLFIGVIPSPILFQGICPVFFPLFQGTCEPFLSLFQGGFPNLNPLVFPIFALLIFEVSFIFQCLPFTPLLPLAY